MWSPFSQFRVVGKLNGAAAAGRLERGLQSHEKAKTIVVANAFGLFYSSGRERSDGAGGTKWRFVSSAMSNRHNQTSRQHRYRIVAR
jgi:hypothetical protein